MRDNQDPRGQLDVLIDERWESVLWDRAKELFEALRALPNNEFYKKELVKKPYRKILDSNRNDGWTKWGAKKQTKGDRWV